MSAIAIRADGLGKRYQLGGAQSYRRARATRCAASLRAPLAPARAVADGDAPARRADGSGRSRDVSFEIRHRRDRRHRSAGTARARARCSRSCRGSPSRRAGRAESRGRVGSLLEVGTGFPPGADRPRERLRQRRDPRHAARARSPRKFDEIVAFAEVERFIDTPVKHYSSGMQMRLAFAVAAHLEPDILLVDEVLAVGDAAFQRSASAR